MSEWEFLENGSYFLIFHDRDQLSLHSNNYSHVVCDLNDTVYFRQVRDRSYNSLLNVKAVLLNVCNI